MRIGMFVDMYLPHVSGVTNHVSLYKRRFEDLGHEVFVFTFGDLDYTDAEPNVIRSGGLPWGRTGWRASLSYSAEARGLIRTLDVAHVHHPFQSGHLLWPLAKHAGIPMVFTNHTRYDLYSDSYASFFPRPLRYWFLRNRLGAFCQASDLVIAPAASIATWLTDFCGYRDAMVVPNGIDIARFASPERSVTRAELGFSDEDVVFCYAGRLGPEKNTEWLAAEFAQATRTAPNARLLVIGEGPSRAAAESVLTHHHAAEKTVFVGMQPYDRVASYEAVADAFVTGSVSEVHPLVVLEAMAAGLPVIAVHSPGISETVTDGVSGLLAASVEDGALASRMSGLAADKGLRERLAAGARVAAGAYALENTADRVLAQYERLRTGSRQAPNP